MMQSPYLITENQPFRILDKAAETGKMHHACLLSGPEGAGKMAVALHFALKLLCRGSGGKPCFACASCRKIREYCHPDFRIVFPFVSVEGFKSVAKELDLKGKHAAGGEGPGTEELYYYYLSECAKDLLAHPFNRPKLSSEFEEKNREISIQQVRDLIEEVQMPPSESPFKVVIFSEADKMAPAAANAFLKTLEEPRSYMKFFLVTSKPRFLLPTIRSRCQEIKFTELRESEIKAFLMEREKAPEAKAALAARFSLGSLPNALEFMDPENGILIEEAFSILEWFIERKPAKALEMAGRFAESSFLQSVRRLKFAALLMHEAGRRRENSAGMEVSGLSERLSDLSVKLPQDLFLQTYDKLMAASSAIERKGNSALMHAALLLSFV
jgi:DNA polymerase III delta' subunit